jgi:hypothetical protein
LDASSDPKVITVWWTRWPTAMIGGVVPRSCIVLDMDPRHGGNLAELEELVGQLPTTLTTISGRLDGGRHFWFRRPLGEICATRLPAGWDLKQSGYVILPPSLHPISGQPYTWERHPVAALPMALWQLLRPRPAPRQTVKGEGHGSGLLRTVLQATPGSRNRALFWAACRAEQDGLRLEAELTEAALSVGLSELEIARTLKSARGR